MVHNIIQRILNNKVVSIIAILAIVGAGYLYVKGDKGSDIETAIVERGTLTQEVSVTGTVKPVKSANLAFERGGKIKGIYAEVGERVGAGVILAETDNGELYGGLLDAQGNLQAEEARLAELKRGTRPEQIQVSKTKVESARATLDDERQAMKDTVADAYTKSDDGIRNRADQLFTNPRGTSPQFNFSIADSQLKINIEQERYHIESALVAWQKDIANLGSTENLSAAIALAKKNLGDVKTLIEHIALAVNSLTPSGSLSQTTIDSYKADISTARTNVNTAITNLSSADQALRSAEQALVLAQNNLSLDEAGSTPEQLAAQEARVAQALAKVKTAQAQFEKTILRSPIAGIITKKDAKVGEIVGANETVLAVITDQNLEVEVNIPETDIAKVNVGDTAVITLDAYSDDIQFDAKVVSIDPAATVIEGVPTYKTTLYFAAGDARIKSGMTANIDILTEKRENVLFVPTRAITTEEGARTVNVEKAPGMIEKVSVEAGLRSSDGRTEVVSGLSEGDRVVTGALPVE